MSNNDEVRISEALAAINKHQKNVLETEREKYVSIPGPIGPPGKSGVDGKSAKLTINGVSVGERPTVSCTLVDEKTNTWGLTFVLPPPEVGARGATGASGATGRTGPAPRIVIGNVVEGETAQADIRTDGDINYLDLVLPRGPRGIAGRDGIDGKSLPGRDGRDGVDGKSIVGDPGPKGDPGMTREEIRDCILEVLSDTGVLTEQAEKLVRVRAALKGAIREADARHQEQVSGIVRSVDKLF